MCYHGDGIAVNKEEAAKYFDIAADKGNADSMNYLALMLDIGDGVKEDKIKTMLMEQIIMVWCSSKAKDSL